MELYVIMNKNSKKEAQVKKLLIFLIVLCLFDAMATDFGIQSGYISEGNPFMKILYDRSRVAFYACKLILPLLLYGIYPKLEHKKLANAGVILCLIVYLAVTVYHLFWMGYAYVGAAFVVFQRVYSF